MLDARVYAAPKGAAYVRQLFYIPAQNGGRLLFYVELFPDFLAFVFY
jgi:hypothetical protein